MNNNGFIYPEGATPLTNDEFQDLIPRHVTTQGELNAVEQMNVAKGLQWLHSNHPTAEIILSDTFIRKLHKKLFGSVWKWAGQFRNTDKNIGVYWIEIAIELKKLTDDTLFQIQYHTYNVDEIVVRFHHRLVQIHPFPNGNGRHARIMANSLLASLSAKPFTWGGTNISNYSQQTKVRASYINALRQADKGNFIPLLTFVRKN